MYASDMTLRVGSLGDADGQWLADTLITGIAKLRHHLPDGAKEALLKIGKGNRDEAVARFLATSTSPDHEAFVTVYAARFEAAFKRHFEAEWARRMGQPA